jgi:hypothetical protein
VDKVQVGLEELLRCRFDEIWNFHVRLQYRMSFPVDVITHLHEAAACVRQYVSLALKLRGLWCCVQLHTISRHVHDKRPFGIVVPKLMPSGHAPFVPRSLIQFTPLVCTRQHLTSPMRLLGTSESKSASNEWAIEQASELCAEVAERHAP